MDPPKRKQPAKGADYASLRKFFYFGAEEAIPESAPQNMFFLADEDSTTKAEKSASSAPELHGKAVSIFQAIGEEVLCGNMDAAFNLLEKWISAENYPTEILKQSSKVSLWEKLAKIVSVNEEMTKLVGYAAYAETRFPVDININAVNCAIRDAIIDGEIPKAMKIVEEFYPKLLYDAPSESRVLYFLEYQQLIELVKGGRGERAQLYAKDSMKSITDSRPWLQEEVERALSLLGYERPLNPYTVLLSASQRHKTAKAVLGAIVAMGMIYKDTLFYHWLK